MNTNVNMKECPNCHKQNRAVARVCRFCHHDMITGKLHKISERNKKIVELIAQVKSKASIARYMNISPERVRQIEHRAKQWQNLS